jgi:hypothetical protein
VPMALLAQAKDLAVGRIQSGEQGGRAVAFVVVLPARGNACASEKPFLA